jgi:hypothetical protein
MKPEIFESAIGDFEMSTHDAAEFFGVTIRTVQHWLKGTSPIPKAIGLTIAVMQDCDISAAQAEEKFRAKKFHWAAPEKIRLDRREGRSGRRAE